MAGNRLRNTGERIRSTGNKRVRDCCGDIATCFDGREVEIVISGLVDNPSACSLDNGTRIETATVFETSAGNCNMFVDVSVAGFGIDCCDAYVHIVLSYTLSTGGVWGWNDPDAARAAIQQLCDGDVVTLPLISSDSDCDVSGATITFQFL